MTRELAIRVSWLRSIAANESERLHGKGPITCSNQARLRELVPQPRGRRAPRRDDHAGDEAANLKVLIPGIHRDSRSFPTLRPVVMS